MNAEELRAVAMEMEPLAPHVDYLLGIARPCVDIRMVEDAPTPECSRFGGDPLVPRDFQWPTATVGEYRFLGQINFSELSDPSLQLPGAGLLSLFVLHDEAGEAFWGDDGFVVGFYSENVGDLQTLRAAASGTAAARRLKLTAGLSLPRCPELREDWPAGDDFQRCLFYDLPAKAGTANDYLLGYPYFYSLGYDPTPGPGWVPLLTLDSRDEFEWCWHDMDMLMVFIEADKLAIRDFSRLRCDAG